MPTPTTISCPACKVKLKLKDDSKLGKTVACPKCDNSFVARSLNDQVEEEFEFAEEADEFDDAPAVPKRGRKQKSADNSGMTLGELGLKIKGVHDLTVEELHEQIEDGAKFVVYQYCISIIVMTFLRSSEIHFIRAGEGRFGPGVGFSALTFFAGWWGIPWGPIYSIMALATNLGGGKDVTEEIVAALS